MLSTIRKTVLQAYSAFLFWKWDREWHASNRRMRGCVHAHTKLCYRLLFLSTPALLLLARTKHKGSA